MAQHKSAKKRAHQALLRQARNTDVKSRMRTLVKRFREALDSGDATASDRLGEAEAAIRKAASHGVIPKRRASRSVGRLAKALQARSS